MKTKKNNNRITQLFERYIAKDHKKTTVNYITKIEVVFKYEYKFVPKFWSKNTTSILFFQFDTSKNSRERIKMRNTSHACSRRSASEMGWQKKCLLTCSECFDFVRGSSCVYKSEKGQKTNGKVQKKARDWKLRVCIVYKWRATDKI